MPTRLLGVLLLPETLPTGQGRSVGVRGGHSPGHLHEGEGHGGSVDGQVPVQVNDDAEIEQVDPH